MKGLREYIVRKVSEELVIVEDVFSLMSDDEKVNLPAPLRVLQMG